MPRTPRNAGQPRVNQVRYRSSNSAGSGPPVRGRFLGECAHAHLHRDHRQPAEAHQHVKRQRDRDPRRRKRQPVPEAEKHAGEELPDHCRRGECEIGDHDRPQRTRDQPRVLRPHGNEQEERDPDPGAEQDRRADDVNVLERLVGHQRSSAIAATRRAATISGSGLISAPSGSVHRPGRSAPRTAT